MSRRTIRIILAALLALLCVVGLLSCAKKRAQAPKPTAETAVVATPVSVVTAMRGPIRETVRTTGTVAAVHEVNVVPEGAGKVTAVYADVGDRVANGSLLVAIDTDLISAQARQADAGVTAAQARLQQARDSVSLTDSTKTINAEQAQKQVGSARTQLAKAQTGAQTTETTVNNQIAQARLGVQSAETQLADVRRGSRDQQKRQAEAEVDMAQAQFDFAKSQYEVKKRLYTQGAASGTEFGSALSEYQAARGRLEQARQGLSLTREGATTEQIRLAELGVDRAKEQLRLAESQRDQVTLAHNDVELAQNQVRLAEDELNLARAGHGEVKIRQGDVDQAAAGIRQAAAARDLMYTTLSKSRVYAPLSGLVSARLTEPGEAANPGMPVFRIVDISKVYVSAVLSETDVKRVTKGQTGIVTVKGIPGATFTGQVVDVNPASLQGQRNFTARVLVENTGEVLRPGMSADVSLVTGGNAAAVLVPRDVIVEDRDRRLVYAVVNNKIDLRPVELGAQEAGRVEVVKGVAEGDILVAAGQSELGQGQDVKPIQRQAGRTSP